ncbi:AAA family ATPase [Sporolactobacillus sp. CQH2019]|uniref:AAA family ATPase n=1 Tax=Sporolactobacillus sp. CQH2019 TaxID=3023512 RepID=UPI00236876FA|nr:AAA family ATPase [Sporolactobacillus sp. CQH2019]MDD9149926.1 AAA family ATPase [Sporolactobacillus sp. CQH2019]
MSTGNNHKVEDLHLVISGTYSTGKTTTTALSIATGIPKIDALSAREILTDLYPGRRFQDMNLTELMALGLKRLEERIKTEATLFSKYGSFISDGSVLNEWIYGTVRLKIGINPGAPFIHQLIKAFLGVPSKSFLKKYMSAYGQVVSLHAKYWYNHVVHLPVEFKMDPDGHRPVSERYRRLSDIELKQIFLTYGIPFYIVGGSLESRLQKIISLLNLQIVVPVPEAIEQAKEIIATNRESVSKRIIEQYHEPNLREKIKILSKY